MASNLVGQKFGRLTVTRDSGERRHGKVLWECRCDCGTILRVPTGALNSGNTRSCGCLKRDTWRDLNITHRMTGTPEYRMLNSARHRAKVSGVPCTITTDDIHIPDVCPVLGMPLTKGVGRQHDGSPTLDRLRFDGGYTSDNVVVMSLLANRVKGKCTSAQVLAVADWMESLGS